MQAESIIHLSLTKLDRNIEEQQRLQNIQEDYFANLLELGLFFQNSGQYQKASDVLKKGIEKASQITTNYLETILGLLD